MHYASRHMRPSGNPTDLACECNLMQHVCADYLVVKPRRGVYVVCVCCYIFGYHGSCLYVSAAKDCGTAMVGPNAKIAEFAKL